MPEQRILSEQEFTAIRDRVLASLPNNLTEEEFTRVIGFTMAQAIGEAESLPPKPEGSVVGRFASNAGQMLNPMGLVDAIRHPIQTLENIGAASAEQGRQAAQAFGEGRNWEAAGHAVGMLPVIGPAAAAAGEQIAAGDVAGGLGKGAGLLAPVAAVQGLRAAGKATGVLPKSGREIVADRLAKIGREKVSDVMAPKVGANKVRFGNMAEAVSPELLKRKSVRGLSREGLHSSVQENLATAEAALDAVADARLNARTFPTSPIIADLMAKRRALTAESVEASQASRVSSTRTSPIVDAQGKPITVTEHAAKPLGRDVEPAPNAPRIAAIDQAIAELKQLGPVARYKSLRDIRQAWDGPAKAVYNPAVTPDFLKAQGSQLGAADVTGSLREALAKFDPETAKANADYTLFRKADDVLKATAEVERTRPRVGRQIMARLTGAVVGGETAGAAGAVGGFVLGPLLESALSAGVTTKLQTARLLSHLSEAIRSGSVGRVQSLRAQLRKVALQGATVAGATNPSGSQSQTTAPAQ